jgi:serpin B
MNADERVDRALDNGDHLTGAVPWRDPDEIRHIARRRTITRRSLFGLAGLVAAGGVADAVWPRGTSGGDQHSPPIAGGVHVNDRSGSAVQLVSYARPLPTSRHAIGPISMAEQLFSLDLLRAVPATTANIVLSPSSLAIALAMLQLGARGTTADEIAKVLHTSDLSAEQQAAGWASLTALQTGDAGSVLESANSVWQQRGLALQPGYMTALKQYFDAWVWQVDFARDMSGALSAIDHWVAAHTHDKITKLFSPGDLDPSTALVLANAEYFKADWQYKFDPSATKPAPFTRADGSRVTVPFMHYSGRLASVFNSRYMAVQLPYAGFRFVAQVIMPTNGTLPDLLKTLRQDDLAAIANTQVIDDGEVVMPRFTAQTYTKLVPALQQLGMHTAFTDAADFSAMSSTPLKVETVVQRDYLRVDETGTEAAAVTGVGMQPTAARVPPAFDHPFLFLVRDTLTGAVLFAGQIQDPSAA